MDPDIPSPKKHSVRLTEIAELMNEMEYDYAHHLIAQLSNENLMVRYTILEGQDASVLGKVEVVQETLHAVVRRDVEFLDDDIVMHTMEHLAQLMEEVEQADDQLLLAMGKLGTNRHLN